MTKNKLIEKLSKFVSKELTNSLGDIAIFRNPDGSYMLFNDYTIMKNDNYEYTVVVDNQYVSLSSLRNAVTWCIYNKRHKTSESHRIVELDNMLGRIDTAILIHKKLMRNSKDVNDKLVHLAKLSQEQLKKKYVEYELSEYVNESKDWQQRKFNQKR